MKVAILPTGTSTGTAVSTIARSLTGNFALAVFAGNKIDAGSTNLKRGYALSSLQSVAKAHSTQLHDGQLHGRARGLGPGRQLRAEGVQLEQRLQQLEQRQSRPDDLQQQQFGAVRGPGSPASVVWPFWAAVGTR